MTGTVAPSKEFGVMPTKRTPRKRSAMDASDQPTRFAEAARKIGADEDEVAFRANLAVIAPHKLAPPQPPEKPNSED